MSSLRSSILVLMLVSACATSRPPERPERVETSQGTIRAASKAKAEAMAVLLTELAPRVPRALPGCASRHVDLRLVDELAHSNWGGATYTMDERRWIELPESEEPEHIAATLVHELVHYQLGPDWSTLPGVLEEGLCDFVAHRIVPQAAALERAEYAVMLASAIDGAIRFDGPLLVGQGNDARFGDAQVTYTVKAPIARDELPTFEAALLLRGRDLETIRAQGIRGVLDALGFLVVDRIGVERLHELCQRAHIEKRALVPPSWIFGAAGLDPNDMEGWRAAIRDQFGEVERRALLRREGLQFRPAGRSPHK